MAIFRFLYGLVAIIRGLLNIAESTKDRAHGRAEAERDQAKAGAQAQDRIGSAAAETVSEDDAIVKLKRGEG